MTTIPTPTPTPSAWRYEQMDGYGRHVSYSYTYSKPTDHNWVSMFTQGQMNEYGQACFEEGYHGVETINEMQAVADRYAHRMALELECVLSDGAYSNRWYKSAMQVLSEYRMAMNAIHEEHSPTFMGEPTLGGIEEGRNSNPTLESMIAKGALTGMVDAQIQAHFGRPTGGIEP